MAGALRVHLSRKHDDPAVLPTAAKAGQSTPSSPDRGTTGDIGVDLATDTLEAGDVQSVKHEEAIQRRGNNQPHSLLPVQPNSGNHGRNDFAGGLWAVLIK